MTPLEAGADPRRSRVQRFQASDGVRSTASTEAAETPFAGPGSASLESLIELWRAMLKRQTARGKRFAIGVHGTRLEGFKRVLAEFVHDVEQAGKGK